MLSHITQFLLFTLRSSEQLQPSAKVGLLPESHYVFHLFVARVSTRKKKELYSKAHLKPIAAKPPSLPGEAEANEIFAAAEKGIDAIRDALISARVCVRM